MPHLHQHPPDRGVVGQLHRHLVVAEPEGPEGAPHGVGVADSRADLLDPDPRGLRFGGDDRRVHAGALAGPPGGAAPLTPPPRAVDWRGSPAASMPGPWRPPPGLRRISTLRPGAVGDLVHLDPPLPR